LRARREIKRSAYIKMMRERERRVRDEARVPGDEAMMRRDASAMKTAHKRDGADAEENAMRRNEMR